MFNFIQTHQLCNRDDCDVNKFSIRRLTSIIIRGSIQFCFVGALNDENFNLSCTFLNKHGIFMKQRVFVKLDILLLFGKNKRWWDLTFLLITYISSFRRGTIFKIIWQLFKLFEFLNFSFGLTWKTFVGSCKYAQKFNTMFHINYSYSNMRLLEVCKFVINI